MKFFSGFVLGILATILSLSVIFYEYEHDATLTSSDTLSGLTMLPEIGRCILNDEVEIFQTLRPNVALAKSGAYPNEILALLINHDGDIYYDRRKLTIPPEKCARQIGTYQYETQSNVLRTVPAVVIK